MAAPVTLSNVIGIWFLQQDIIDFVILGSQVQPVELGHPVDRHIFLTCTDSLIPFGMQPLALQRRWMVSQFVDYMINARTTRYIVRISTTYAESAPCPRNGYNANNNCDSRTARSR